MCSTEPAIDPATMNCQNWRPSWELDDKTANSGWKSAGRKSGFWNLVEASVAIAAVVVVALVGRDGGRP